MTDYFIDLYFQSTVLVMMRTELKTMCGYRTFS